VRKLETKRADEDGGVVAGRGLCSFRFGPKQVSARVHVSRFTFHESRVTCQALRATLGVLLLSLVTLRAAIPEAQLPPPATITVDFAHDIKPILEQSCYKCHGGDRPRGHFRLTSREAALKGGSEGVDIIPQQSGKSLLIRYVARLDPEHEMPPEGKGTPLTTEQVGLLRAWIDQGLAWEETMLEPRDKASVSPTLGYTWASGDKAKFRELNWQREGWNRGLEDFEITHNGVDGSKVTAAGRILRDDYKVTLEATKNELGFAHFGWSEYRKYYDSTGVYNPLISSSPFDLNTDLHKDIGKAYAELGLTLPNWPKFVIGYEEQWRNGTESTLAYGPVSNGTNTSNIYPASKSVNERTRTLKFDVEYEPSGWLITDSFRGEWYNLSTTTFNSAAYTNGAADMATAVTDETEKHFQGANTVHLEKQLHQKLFAAAGYLYSKYDGDASINVSNLNPAILNFDPALPQWHSESITLKRESHVFSVAAMLGQWEGLTLSLASQNEWTRQQGMGTASGEIALPFAPYYFGFAPETNSSDLDTSKFTQSASLRFTKIPFTTLYGDAKVQQERLGEYEEEIGGLTQFMRNTDTKNNLEDVRAGFNTSPWRNVSLNGYYRYSDSDTDYDTNLKQTSSSYVSYEGYPGFIRWRDLLANEAQARLSLQPISWLRTSLSYKWLSEAYKASTDSANYVDQSNGAITTDGITPGGSLLAGRYDAQSVSANFTLTPWRRLFASATFTFENARTTTYANGSDSVAPYRGNTWGTMANATYILDDKTDVSASYSFSLARFGQDSSGTSAIYDLDYTLHSLSVSLSHRFTRNLSASLRYGFYLYDEPSSGGANNYEAHAVFATLSYHWP
jgi:hypothetical protein